MIDLGDFTTTAILPLSDAPQAWTNPGPQTSVVLGAFGADACPSLSADATHDDFRLSVGCDARLRLDQGATLSAVAAEGDSPAAAAVRITLAGEA